MPWPMSGSLCPAASPTNTTPSATGWSVQVSFIGNDAHGPAGSADASSSLPGRQRRRNAASIRSAAPRPRKRSACAGGESTYRRACPPPRGNT